MQTLNEIYKKIEFHFVFEVSKDKKFCMVEFCVAILETLHGTHGKKIFILRPKNLSKHCLLRCFCLNIKIQKLLILKPKSLSRCFVVSILRFKKS